MRTFLVTVLAFTSAANAQEQGFDAHGFVPGPLEATVRDPISWVRPGVFFPGDVYLGVIGEYVRRPLVAVTTSVSGGDLSERALIRDLAVANIVGGVAFHERLRLDVAVPVYAVSANDAGVMGPAPGDVRSTLTGVFFRPDETVGGGGTGLGASIWLDAPTGMPDRYLGREGIGGGGRLSFSAESPVVTMNTFVGMQFDPSIDVANITGSDTFLGGLGFAFALSDTVGLGVEAHGAFSLSQNAVKGSASPAEALMALKVIGDEGRPVYTIGVGRAITRGIGAPDLRAFVGIAVGRKKGLREADTDIISSVLVADECPVQPETRNGYLDEDGCPDQLGTVRPMVTFEGQPRLGALLTIAGLPEAYESPLRPEMPQLTVLPGTELTAIAVSDGCLTGQMEMSIEEGDNLLTVDLQRVLDARVTVQVEDLDGNRIEGAEVAWLSDTPLCVPGEAQTVGTSGRVQTAVGAGEHNLVVDAEGYEMIYEPFVFESGQDRDLVVVLTSIVVEEPEPQNALVVVERRRIVILEKVLFETAKAVIRPESFELLDQVSQIIVDNPQVGRVEVGGHTDSRGSDRYNMDLSQRRSDAVRAFLIRRGVTEDRLIAVGNGEERPISDNETEEGREANRRVEFNLIDVPEDDQPTDAEPTPDAPVQETP